LIYGLNHVNLCNYDQNTTGHILVNIFNFSRWS